MMIELCDVHSHILPGLDDGSRDIEETMQTLREAYCQGVRAVIATPHYYPERYEPNAEKILSVCRLVSNTCGRQHLAIQIYPGQECFYYSGLIDKLNRGEILTLAGSRYVLVEFAPYSPYQQIRQGLLSLMNEGYRPVLAHFERYTALEREDRLEELHSYGVLLQMNFDTFSHRKWFGKSRWQSLMQQGIVDLVGSDCHGVHFRPYHADEAVRWMEKNLSPEIQEKILVHSIQRILRKTDRRKYGKDNGETACGDRHAGRRDGD